MYGTRIRIESELTDSLRRTEKREKEGDTDLLMRSRRGGGCGSFFLLFLHEGSNGVRILSFVEIFRGSREFIIIIFTLHLKPCNPRLCHVSNAELTCSVLVIPQPCSGVKPHWMAITQ
jgi:hypothetical protein